MAIHQAIGNASSCFWVLEPIYLCQRRMLFRRAIFGLCRFDHVNLARKDDARSIECRNRMRYAAHAHRYLTRLRSIGIGSPKLVVVHIEQRFPIARKRQVVRIGCHIPHRAIDMRLRLEVEPHQYARRCVARQIVVFCHHQSRLPVGAQGKFTRASDLEQIFNRQCAFHLFSKFALAIGRERKKSPVFGQKKTAQKGLFNEYGAYWV